MRTPPPMWSGAADARRLFALLAPDSGSVVELRALGVRGVRGTGVVSGYFDEVEKFVAAAASLDGRAEGVYATLNPVRPELLARANNRLVEGPRRTTSDDEIVGRRHLLVDADASRPAGISASAEEQEAAIVVAREVVAHLASVGFPAPIAADSGNGAHALYRIDVPADDDGLVQRVLDALAFRFNTARVKIDTAVANPARICKLYGTVACKGDATPERPHRRSAILLVPEPLLVVPREALEAVAAQAPDPKAGADAKAGHDGAFDVDGFLARHGIAVRRRGPWRDGLRWILEVCPFNPAHADGAAYVVQFSSGAVAAGCRHDGCANKAWRDLRAIFEPPGSRGAAGAARRPFANPNSADFADAPGGAWSSPTPIDARRVPDFPTLALPSWLAEWVEAEAEAVQVPAALPGSVALGVCSAAVSRAGLYVDAGGWREPTNLYVVAALESGNRKSTVFGHATAPFLEWERAMEKKHGRAVARSRQLLDVTLARLADAKKRAAKATTPLEQTKLLKDVERLTDEVEDSPEPVLPRLFTSDVTTEHLGTMIGQQGGAFAVLAPEGGVFETIAGRYSEGVPNLDLWLNGHAGDPVRVDRGSRPPVILDRPRLATVLTVQPDVLSGLARKDGFRGRGLLARFAYTIPVSLLGRRRVTPDSMPSHVELSYHESVARLLGLGRELPEGEVEPTLLRFDADAAEHMLVLRRSVEPRLGREGDLAFLRDWGSKFPGLVARIAGVLHVVEAPEETGRLLTGRTFERAARIGEFFLAHALAAFDEMGADAACAGARHILDWIRPRWRPVVTRREIFEGVRGATLLRSVEAVDASLDVLVEAGWLRPVQREEKKGVGRPSGGRFEVHPLANTSAKSAKLGVDGSSADFADVAEGSTATKQGEGEAA